MAASTIVWSEAEAQVRLSRAALTTDVGVAHGAPIIVVDIGSDRRGGLPDLPASFPALLIARRADDGAALQPVGARSNSGADLTLSAADTDRVIDATLAHPHAAVALTQLLRVSATIPVPDALVAESMAYGLLQGGPEHRTWLDAQGRRVRPDTDEPPVLVHEGVDGVRLSLNRPRLHNAYNAAMRNTLLAILDRLDDAGDTRPITLDAAGRSFCVGGDLAEFGTVSDPSTAHHLRMATSVGLRLHRLRDRLTVVTQGASVGAGVELAAFAGRVVARPDATFALPEVELGLVPGAGGTVSVTRRIGRHRALWLALTGDKIDADRARAWGLVDEVHPADRDPT